MSVPRFLAVYTMKPEDFAAFVRAFPENGIVGGNVTADDVFFV